MLVPSRNVMPRWTPRSWARSSRRSQTPRWAQRMNICAARDQGPRSAGMARHLAPFSCRQTIAEMVRRRSFGCVLPLGRHASTNGSKLIHCASDSIALSSFQEGQNARHHNQFKREHALAQRLGNVKSGDGALFHGRGYVQLTGRSNYTDWATRLKIDLINNPNLALDPTSAAEILF